MSVMIKGVKMPDSCMECGACIPIEENGDLCFCGFDEYARDIELKLHFKPVWCPLVEVEEDDDE